MPLPFLLWGAAALAGVVGIGAGVTGKSDMDKAKRISDLAKEKYDEKEEEYKEAIEALNQVFENLGKTRLIASSHIQVLIENLKRIGTVNQKDYQKLLETIHYTKEKMQEMEQIALKSSEIVKMGFNAVGTGAAAGMGAVGLVSAFGVASTGTAISGLAGVAATNATMAALGGGSLAAGGFGVAGGAVALGGIFLAPVALIGGFALASKGEKALTEARKYEAEVEKAIAQLDTRMSFIEQAEKIAKDYIEIIKTLDSKAVQAYQNVGVIIDFYIDKHNSSMNNRPWWKKLFGLGKIDYLSLSNWASEDQEKLKISTQFAHTINDLCSIQIVDEDSVRDDSQKLLTRVTQQYID